MSNMLDCRIIRDLLPNYVEGLLSDYSKKAVEEHLEECSKCQEIYKDMNWDTSMQNVEGNYLEAKKIKRFMNKVKVRNLIVGIILSTIVFSIIGIGTWGWYKTEYLTSNVVVPIDKVKVLEVTDNNNGTVHVKLASDTEYAVESCTVRQDKNNPSVFVLQMYHTKKAPTVTAEYTNQYDGYSLIFDAEIAVDTEHHENIGTIYDNYSNNDDVEDKNEIAKNKIVVRGEDSEQDVVLWEEE